MLWSHIGIIRNSKLGPGFGTAPPSGPSLQLCFERQLSPPYLRSEIGMLGSGTGIPGATERLAVSARHISVTEGGLRVELSLDSWPRKTSPALLVEPPDARM